jgi:predicted ATPase
MTIPLPLQSFRLQNFKAVRDSGIIEFTPLTVFIGNNGSGKSSVIEGLDMLQTIVTSDLDTAMLPWRDFRDVLNKAVMHKEVAALPGGRAYYTNPMSFDLRGQLESRVNVKYSLEVSDGPAGNDLFIKQEAFSQKGPDVVPCDFARDSLGHVTGAYVLDKKETIDARLQDGISLLNLGKAHYPYDTLLRIFIRNWQFVSLVPQRMSDPKRQKRAIHRVRLEKDGSNVAEYLAEVQKLDPSAFADIISSLQLILPYSQDLQIPLTSELERAVYLQLTEESFKISSWLMSTGTLRILALLALLHHPSPPPLIVIEEIENGLDPQSINLIINEIRNVIEAGMTQIIITTHSPYLLDLLDLDHIVLVDRVQGQPVFRRPRNNQKLQEWAKSFGLGGLYTGGRLSGGI